jgi:hypothetical protein
LHQLLVSFKAPGASSGVTREVNPLKFYHTLYKRVQNALWPTKFLIERIDRSDQEIILKIEFDGVCTALEQLRMFTSGEGDPLDNKNELASELILIFGYVKEARKYSYLTVEFKEQIISIQEKLNSASGMIDRRLFDLGLG